MARSITALLLMALFLFGSPTVQADTVVVVSARAGIERMSQDEVINVFLGRYRRLPNGEAALAFDLPEDNPVRADFYRRLVNKGVHEIRAYWTRLVFSGKTSPPRLARSATELEKLLLADPGGIAYLDRRQVSSRMRIVFEFAP